MSGRLLKEIKQTRPFSSLEEELFLNLFRTVDFLARDHGELLKTQLLSSEQYNVLRILRGAGESGLPCSEIGARMVTRSPDITRLLDKLVARGLVTRARSEEDRRVVYATIAPQGLVTLSTLDRPMQELNRTSLSHMSERDLRNAIALLEKMRGRSDDDNLKKKP